MEIKKGVFRFLSLLFVATIFCGISYFLVQQDLRWSANDPQIQMAEDGAVALGSGATATSVAAAPIVDISRSLSPFVIVFDDNGKPIASSAVLNGATPTIPFGIFQYVRMSGEDRFTWQPENGVRIAAVVVRFSGTSSGFILAGRSLREVEKREDNALMIVGIGFVLVLILLFVSWIYLVPSA